MNHPSPSWPDRRSTLMRGNPTLPGPAAGSVARPSGCGLAAQSGESISLVNLAARQRMLSQRMLLQTLLAARGDAAQLQAATDSLALFRYSHLRLLSTVEAADEVNAQRIRSTYHGVSGVGPRIEEFMRCADEVLRAIGTGDPHPLGLAELVAGNDAVLAALNTATTTFDTIGKGKSLQMMKELTGIVSDIQTIAREAKIVSFNAQVIAARAGQHGREFAVVASVLSGISTEIDGMSRKAIDLADRNAQSIA